MSSHLFPTLDTLQVRNKRVLVRVDLNVPMEGGRVTDDTRIVRILPTLRELAGKGAKVIILSHFGRPKGRFDPSMSLAPLVDALSKALGEDVFFGVDCIGESAREAVEKLQPGQYLLLENLRFYAEEEARDAGAFAASLAELGDLYVNDAFSCSHRAHASISGLPKLLPYAAGRLLQQEVETLDALFSGADRPISAVIGGSKVSTKLALLENLMKRVDTLIIGGAMANTFLAAKGYSVGCSLHEPDLKETALAILSKAETQGCQILLPVDVVAASCLAPQSSSIISGVEKLPQDRMIVDIGPQTMGLYAQALRESKTAVWNGPIGAFEISPFDCGTVTIARLLAGFTRSNGLKTVAGGGDTVAAVSHAGLGNEFTYLSTAGGAFLEWLEGKELPGLTALRPAGEKYASAAGPAQRAGASTGPAIWKSLTAHFHRLQKKLP